MRQISGEGNAAAQAECVLRRHGGGKPEWGSPQNACILWGPRVGGGNQDNPRDEPLFAASPNATRTLTECLGSHTNAFLLSAKGARFLSGSEINTSGCFAFKRIRKFIFLLSAKGSENDKGGIFRVAPFVNPKTPHTPIDGKRVRGKNPPPCLRGQKGNVNKRTNEMGTSAHQKTRRRS